MTCNQISTDLLNTSKATETKANKQTSINLNNKQKMITYPWSQRLPLLRFDYIPQRPAIEGYPTKIFIPQQSAGSKNSFGFDQGSVCIPSSFYRSMILQPGENFGQLRWSSSDASAHCASMIRHSMDCLSGPADWSFIKIGEFRCLLLADREIGARKRCLPSCLLWSCPSPTRCSIIWWLVSQQLLGSTFRQMVMS